MVVKYKANHTKVIALRQSNPFATLQEIATATNITRERVRQILTRAKVATKAEKVIRACEVCGKPLNHNQPRRCSRYCRHQASIAEVVCSNCDKVFELLKSQLSARKKRHLSDYFFCSKVCYGQFFGKNYGFPAHPENIKTPKRSEN